MATYRAVLAVACMALAMLAAGACQQLNEALNDRDVECGEVPEDVCIRLANHAASDYERLNPELAPVVKVLVDPEHCAENSGFNGRPWNVASSCWRVEVGTRPATGPATGADTFYYQREDNGMLIGPDGQLIGS